MLAFIIVFFGALVQSLIGFGLAVVACPLLYLVDPRYVPGPIIIVGFSTALLTLLRERSNLEFNGLQYALLGRIPGGYIGAFLLLLAPQPILGLIIAAIVAAAVCVSLSRISLRINRKNLFIAGTLSGVFGSIAAIGGPPMAILLADKNAAQFRASLSAFFVCSSTMTLVILASVGLFGWQDLWLGLGLLPVVLLTHKLSGTWVHKIDKQKTKVATLVLCSASALLLAIKSIQALI